MDISLFYVGSMASTNVNKELKIHPAIIKSNSVRTFKPLSLSLDVS